MGGTFHQFKTTNKKIICRTEPLEAAANACGIHTTVLDCLPLTHPLSICHKGHQENAGRKIPALGAPGSAAQTGALTEPHCSHELSFRRAHPQALSEKQLWLS